MDNKMNTINNELDKNLVKEYDEKFRLNKMSYNSLLDIAIEIYSKGKYLEAYYFITHNAEKVKGNRAQIFNFRYCFACKAGLDELALQIMKEAIDDEGFWYSYEYLNEEEDLDSLRKYNEFDRLVSVCKQREAKAKQSVKPELKIIKTNDNGKEDKYPLILALHGNQENISISEEYWNWSTTDYLLALPQSSQIQVSDGYVWDDIEKGSKELEYHYEEILKKYPVDKDNVIVAGFSAGARVALHSVLEDKILVKGLIFIAPWLPEIDEWNHLLNKLKDKAIKTYVICGDKDNDCFECTEKFVGLLKKNDIPFEFKVIKGLDHSYPNNYEEVLRDALNYIMLEAD